MEFYNSSCPMARGVLRKISGNGEATFEKGYWEKIFYFGTIGNTFN